MRYDSLPSGHECSQHAVGIFKSQDVGVKHHFSTSSYFPLCAHFLPDLVLCLRSVVISIDVLRACMSEHELIAPKCRCQCISVSYERAVWLVECHGRSLMIDA